MKNLLLLIIILFTSCYSNVNNYELKYTCLKGHYKQYEKTKITYLYDELIIGTEKDSVWVCDSAFIDTVYLKN